MASPTIGHVTTVDAPTIRTSSAIWAPLLALLTIVAIAAAATYSAVAQVLAILAIGLVMVVALQRLTRGLAGRAFRAIAVAEVAVKSLSPLPTPIDEPSQSFQIRGSDGYETRAILVGMPDGWSVAAGDHVAVEGRLSHRGDVLHVRSVRDLATGVVARSRRLPRLIVNRVALWLLPLAAAGTVYAVYQLL